MLNWIVNYVVGTFLNNYLEIDTSKTNTGITTGKYVLENIKLKKDLFSKINLPFFEIKNSFIGKISIELTKLMTLHPEDYPIIVSISDVFVNINQKGISEWDEEKKLVELQNAKNLFLKNIEDFYSNYLQTQNNSTDSENQKSSDFLKKIVNNLSFSVHNVIVRVEDDVSYPTNPYALALTLKSLKTQPNKDFQNQFKIHESQSEALKIQKVLVLDDLSLYMDIKEGLKDNDYVNFITEKGRAKARELGDYLESDKDETDWYAYCHSELEEHLRFNQAHSYLLHNLDLTLRLDFNQDYLINYEEFIKCDLRIRSLDFYLSLQQLKVLLKVSAFITGIQSSYYYEIEEKFFKKEMESDKAAVYVQNYIEYFYAKHFQKKDESEFQTQKDILATIEEHYKFDYLQKIRYLTYDNLKFLAKLHSLERKIDEKTPGIVTGLFASEQTLVELEDLKKEKDLLYAKKSDIASKLEHYITNINNKEYIDKEIEDEKNLAKEEEQKSLPADYVKMWVKLVIENFKISLRTDKIFIKKVENEDENNEEAENKFGQRRNKNYNKNKSKNYYDYNNINNNKNDPNSKINHYENLGFPGENDSKHSLLEENQKYIEDIIIINLMHLETLVLKGMEKTELYLFLGDIEISQFLSKHETFYKLLESHYEKRQDEDIIDNSLYETEKAKAKITFQNKNEKNANANTHNKPFNNATEKYSENPRKRATYNFDDNSANKYEKDFDIKCGALFISFEINPELPSSPMRLRIRNAKRLYIYLNIYCLQMLGFLLSEVLNSEMDFDTIAKNTTEKSFQNIQKGYKKMKTKVVEGDYKPFAMHADIILKSPRIVFPQDITSNTNKDCVVVSMGELTLKSHLANRIPSEKVVNVRTLKYYDNLFDHYDVNLSNFEVNLIFNFESLDKLNECLIKEETVCDKVIPVVEKLNMSLLLSQLIEPKNIYNEKFKVGVKIEEFVLNFNEEIVEFLSQTLYCYNYFSVFYEIEVSVIKKDPVYIKLTNVRNKNAIDPMIDYSKIDEKFNKAIGKKKEKTQEEQKQEEIEGVDDQIMLKAKARKKAEIGDQNGFIGKLNDKLQGKDEIDKLKQYEIEKLNEIREKILQGEHEKFLLEFNLIIERISFNFQKNISEEEKKLLVKYNKDLNAEKIKPFFAISLMNFRINLAIKEDFGLNFAMAMEYFLIFDNESVWKIEEKKLTQKLILNSDFQFLFSSNRIPDEKIEQSLNEFKSTNMHNFIDKSDKSDKRNIKATDIYKIYKGVHNKNTAHIKKLYLFVENKKLLEDENSKNNNLIYVKILLDKKTNTIKIQTFLNDLRLILNISTLARMKVYFLKLSDIYSKIAAKEIPLQKTLDKIKQEEQERIKQENNKRFKGLIKIPNENNNKENNNNKNNENNQNNKNNEEEIVEEKNEQRRNFLKKLKDRLQYRRENNGREMPINFPKKESTEIENVFELLSEMDETSSNNNDNNNNALYFENELVKENKFLQSNSGEFKYLKKNFFFSEEKSKLKFLLHINRIDIEIPMDAESYNTDLIFIDFKLNAKIRKETENQNIFEYDFGEGEILDFSITENLKEKMSEKDFKTKLILVAKNFAKNDINVNFMLNDFDINLEKYIGGLIWENDQEQKLISNLRISGHFKKFIFTKKKSYISNAQIKLEPILINMGLSHLKILQNYSEHMQKTLKLTDEKKAEDEKQKEKDLTNKRNDQLQKFESFAFEDLIESANKQQFISSHKLPGNDIKSKQSQMNLGMTDRHNLIAQSAKKSDELNEPKIKNLLEANLRSKLQSRKIHKKKTEKAKSKKDIIFNLKDFNELFDFDITLEKFKAEVYDDMGKYVCHLLNFEMSNLSAKYVANTKPYDTENYFKFFIELISNNQAKEFNLFNLYFYLKLKMLLEIKIFNEKFYNWEPLAEPIELNFSIHQIDKAAKINYRIICDKMIDLNLSTNFVFNANKIAKNFKQNLKNKHQNNFFLDLHAKNSRVYSGLKALESKNNNNSNTNNNGLHDNKIKEHKNPSSTSIVNLTDSKREKSGKEAGAAYGDLVASVKNNFFVKKTNEQKIEGKYLKFVNDTGIDLTCILLDRTEQNQICRLIPADGVLKIAKAEISDVYFGTKKYERKKITNESLMKIYVNEVDYLIESVDYSMNKVSIFRIDSFNWKQPNDKLYEKITGSSRSKNNKVKNNSFYGEILVKTKFIRNAKLIILESNISFFNNTNHAIRLAFVKSSLLTTINQLNNNTNNNNNGKLINDNNPINNDENKTDNKNSKSKNIVDLAERTIECKIRNNTRIPLKYIFHNYEVYIGLMFKKAQKRSAENLNKIFISNLPKIEYEYQEVFRLFSTSLKYIYVLGIDYVNMELQNLKGEKKENYLKELNQKYCTLISFKPECFENANPAFQKTIISSDILLLKSDDDITYAGDIIDLKDKSELLEAREKSYHFTIVLNPPVVVSNRSPKEFVLDLDADKEILKADEPSNFIIKPLDNFHFYLFDMFENTKKSRIGFKSDANFNVVDFNSHAFDFKVTDNQKSRLRISNVENKDDFVDLIIETDMNCIDRIYKPNFYTQEIFFCKSRIVNLYFEIVVINRLEKHIVFNPLSRYYADEAKQFENQEKNKNKNNVNTNNNKNTEKNNKEKVLAVYDANTNLVKEEKEKKYENLNNENDFNSNNNKNYNTNNNKNYNGTNNFHNQNKNEEKIENEKYQKNLENQDSYSPEELSFFSNHKKSYLIRTCEIGVFSIMDKNVRAKIKIGNSEYSNDFDFVNDSKNKIPSFANTDKQFEFHCLVRNSSTFNFSKILILEPRYYVLNKTKLNLKYREVHFKEIKNGKININHKNNGNTGSNNKNNQNSKNIPNDKVYSNNIHELNPEEEKILLLENQNYTQQPKKSLSKKELEKERKRKELISSKNIHEFNFLQLFVDEKFNYVENAQANDDLIEKDDDLGNKIYSEENKNDAENKKTNINNNHNNNNNLEIINQNKNQKWTSIINIDVDQDIDFKLEISKEFYLDCLQKIKQTVELLGDKEVTEIDQAQLKKFKQIIALKNLFTYDNEKFYILLRMTSRKYDNGLRYLILSEPEFPDLMLNNTTDYDVIINHVGSEEKVIVQKNTQQIITLSDIHDLKSENISYIEVEIKELELKSIINLKKIHDLIDLQANKNLKSEKKMKPNILDDKGARVDNYFAYLDTENSNITRVIKIFEKNKMNQKSDFYMSDQLKNQSASYILDCKLKGIGVSLVNMSSQEYFYVSFYKIKFQSSNNMIKSLNYINDKADINFKIYNIQADYCKENLLSKKKIDRMYKNNYQTLLKPKFQFTPYHEINIVKETFFPFLYLNIVTNTFLNSETNQKTNKVSEIKLNIGEFDLTIDQNMLSSLLEIILEFSDEIDFNKKTTEKERDSAVDERMNLKPENKGVSASAKNENENAEIENVNINQPKPLLLENELSKYIDQAGYRLKGSIMNIKFFTEAYLKTAVESAERKLIELNNDAIFYIENLVVYPIIFTVNTKVDVTSIKLGALPQSVLNLIGFFANSITNLSDLRICFEKVEIEDLYDRINNILAEVSSCYFNQVYGFIGDVISNTNLIGNPIKQIKKVMKNFDGIFDEDMELKQKYGKEAHKKLNAHFEITLEKGFDSVDKIIRNALCLKSKQEDYQRNGIDINNKNNKNNEYLDGFDNAENNKYLVQAGNLMQNAYKTDIEMHLVKSEKQLLSGTEENKAKEANKYNLAKINTIFNPFATNSEKILTNIIHSNINNNNNKLNQIDNNNHIDKPTSLFYPFANPVFQMFEKELNLDFNNMFDIYYSDKKGVNYDRPKIETNRFRHPRVNLNKSYLRNYSYSQAEITMMLMSLFSKKFLKENHSNIVYTKNLFTYDDYLVEQYTSIIMTDSRFLVITDAKQKKFDFELKDLFDVQIFEIEKAKKFKINFILRNGKNYYFFTKDFDSLYEIESVIGKLKSDSFPQFLK